MTKFKSPNIIKSISYAVRGLKLAVSSQRNFASEIFISICVLFLGLALKFTSTDLCILIIMITIVLICELLNSVIEFTLDAVYKNNYSKLVEMAKDMSAGIVLLSAIMSILVGVLLFGTYIFKIIRLF